MSRQIILNAEKLETRFALLNNGLLEEYFIERVSEEAQVGSVYLGKITNLEPSLEAAFVDIGPGKNAFLHYRDMLSGGDELIEKLHDQAENQIERKNKTRQHSTSARRRNSRLENLYNFARQLKGRRLTVADIPNLFKPGMEILVQVVKGPIGNKGARVTTELSIPGRFLVLLPYSDHIGLSTKIESQQERTRLRKIMSELDVPEGMGVICRTVGEGRKAIYFKHDLELLLDYWRKIEDAIEEGRPPGPVYREPGLLERSVRDFVTEDIDEIVVDNKDAYEQIHAMLKRFGGRKMSSKVTRYSKTEPIFDHFKINQELEKVYQRKVELPSGGWLCIDETEALIAIDVNTGRSKHTGDHPEYILKTNLEAAGEIARQLRLRNVGGLVVLDFIDMRLQRDRDEVYKAMKKLTKLDRAKTRVLPISRLGLMEMTRQREHESVLDTVYDPCPYCNGTGLVKSALSTSVEIQRRLHAVMRDRKYRDTPIRVVMHPEVLARLKNQDAELLSELEASYARSLTFRADATLHYEEFRLVDSDTGMEIKY